MNNFFRIFFSISLASAVPTLASGSEPPEVMRMLGEGTSATTFLAEWRGMQVAFKVFKKTNSAEKPLRRERHVLRKLNRHGGHPQIIGLLGYVDDPMFGLILQLMQSDLPGFVDDGLVSSTDWHNLLTQIFLGLSHVHDRGYVFGDLKPDNILCSNENGLLHVKLTDFGWTRRPQSSEEQGGKRPGALAFMAPEVFFLEGFDQKADMWSAGVLIGGYLAGIPLTALITPSHYHGRLLSHHDNLLFMMSFFVEARVRGHILTPMLKGPYKKLVDNLCTLNPEERMNADEARESLREIDPQDFVTFYKGSIEPTALEAIGVGATAIIYMGLFNGDAVAYKVMNKRFEHHFDTELSALQKLHRRGAHPQIVGLIDHVDSPDRRGLILELLDCDLFDAIKERVVDTDDTQDILIQIFEGLAHIHRCGLVYGDLKPENILCKIYDTIIEIKLADFGVTRAPGEAYRGSRGSLEFMAPEIFARDRYDAKADMWSAGLLVAELCHGTNPQIKSVMENWQSMSNEEKDKHLERFFRKAKKRGFIKVGPLKSPVRAFVRNLCAIDPTARPSATEALTTLCSISSAAFAPKHSQSPAGRITKKGSHN